MRPFAGLTVFLLASLAAPPASGAGPVVKTWIAPEDGGRRTCYWFRTERGVVVVNAPRLTDHARALRAELAGDGEPGALVVSGLSPDGALGATALLGPTARVWIARSFAASLDRRLAAFREERIRAGLLADRLPAEVPRSANLWSGSLNLGFEGFTLRLVELGQGEGFSFTPTVAAISETGEVFPGDLVWNRVHPELEGRDLREWRRLLERVLAMRPRAVFPGAGGSGGRDVVDTFATYLAFVEEQVQPLAVPGKSGLTKAELAALKRTVTRKFAWELPANLESSLVAEFARQRTQRFGR